MLVIARFLLADKINTILLTYLLGEVLTDIRALAYYFSLISLCAYLVSTTGGYSDLRIPIHGPYCSMSYVA
jgi:hypothetical protein